MFCAECGTRNTDSARFCIKCGAPLPQASATEPQVSISPLPGADRKPAPRSRRSRVWIAIMVPTLLFLAVSTLFVWSIVGPPALLEPLLATEVTRIVTRSVPVEKVVHATVLVERETTRVVEKVIKETVIIPATPRVVDREVTQIVTKEVTRVVEKEVVVTATSTPTPEQAALSVPILSSRIVFASDRGGDLDLYVMNEDGTGLAQLTSSRGEDILPSWSPGGEWIAFASERSGNLDIWVIRGDGSSSMPLIEHAAQDSFPAWSPDGRWIAFASDRAGNYELYRVHPDGSGLEQLTETPEDEMRPTWAPDSQRLAFMRRSDTNSDGRIDDADAAGDDVFVLEVGSGSETRLTTTANADTMPAWSPTGKWIAFVSDREQVGEIYVMKEDGTQQVRWTFGTAWDWFPAWSPSGTHLAFQSDRSGDFEIWALPVEGGDPVNLTRNPADDIHPAWSWR